MDSAGCACAYIVIRRGSSLVKGNIPGRIGAVLTSGVIDMLLLDGQRRLARFCWAWRNIIRNPGDTSIDCRLTLRPEGGVQVQVPGSLRRSSGLYVGTNRCGGSVS